MKVNADKSAAIKAYFEVAPIYCQPYGNGHINDTFLVVLENNEKYILQRMNTEVFPCPVELMGNILGVTGHIRGKAKELGSEADRATLTVVPTLNGEQYFVDPFGCYWRLYLYVRDAVTYEMVESVEQFYSCAVAFGKFQRMLADYPAETLFEVIPDFHNTADRYNKLMEAAEKNAFDRLKDVMAEMEFIRCRRKTCCVLEEAHKSGSLPLRVTHNDTKLNNILFDANTGEPVCVIDLDTVMPGYSVVDFGDAIRFGANHASEDETDADKIKLDLELFEWYVRGFLKGCDGSLTEKEIELLPMGALVVTLECGIRFLTDYLNGDTYFKIKHSQHNLQRCRRQLILAYDMESKLDEMKSVVNRVSRET